MMLDFKLSSLLLASGWLAEADASPARIETQAS